MNAKRFYLSFGILLLLNCLSYVLIGSEITFYADFYLAIILIVVVSILDLKKCKEVKKCSKN